MHFEIWRIVPDEVWSNFLYSTEDELEARRYYEEQRAEHGDEIDIYKVDDNDNVYAVEFL